MALKARLMDQHRLAGVGNLIADEVLWRASLVTAPTVRLTDAGRTPPTPPSSPPTLDELMRRGGSHLGDLMPERDASADGARATGPSSSASTVGGRTSWWCPVHQH